MADVQLHLEVNFMGGGRGERSGSMASVTSLSDDFLPLVSEFLMQPANCRDRAFSWDVAVDEGLDPESLQALMAQGTGRERSRSGSLGIMSIGSGSGPGRDRGTSFASFLVDDMFSDDGESSPILVNKKRKAAPSSPLCPKKLKGLVGIADFEDDLDWADDMEDEPFGFMDDNSPLNFIVAKRPSIGSGSGAGSGAGAGNGAGSGGSGVPRSGRAPYKATARKAVDSSMGDDDSLGFHDTPLFKSQERPVYASSSSSSSSSYNPPPSRPMGPLYGPEPELTIATFGPMNGVVVGDGCRVGVYTREERQKRIERFREKKLKRIWRKQIKYDCRKRLADTRPRVKGRFVSRAGDGTDPPADKIGVADVDLSIPVYKPLKADGSDFECVGDHVRHRKDSLSLIFDIIG